MKKEIVKAQNGITLIALVITIIVLLILASVSIAMLTGENGILNQATKSKEATTQAKVEEMVSVAIMSLRTENLGDTSKITPQAIADQVNEENSRTDVTASSVTFPTNIEFELEGLQVPVSADLAIGNSVQGPPKPIYSVPVEESKIAPAELFCYEPITDAKVASTTSKDMSNLPQKEARITGMNPKYCNKINTFDGTYVTDTGEVHTDTNYEIKHPQITNTLIVPYQLEINGEMYRVTEVNLSLRYSYPVNLPSIENIIYPNTVNKIKGDINYQGYMRPIDSNKLVYMVLPSNITEIPDYFFSDARKLTKIEIPSKVTRIGEYAFEDCRSLTDITIPENLTSIGVNAFSHTPWNNNLPDGDVYLGKVYYKYNGEMSEETRKIIKDGTVSIGHRAFSDCESLVNITLPSSVNVIDSYAFYNCTSLTNITIPENVISIEEDAFSGCVSLTDLEILDGVKSIGNGAFWGCTALTNVVIPNSVTSIGIRTFGDCTALANIRIPENITNVGYSAVSNTLWYNNLPDGDIYIGKTYYEYKGNVPKDTIIKIKEGTTSIVGYAFEDRTSLTDIIIPESVTSIGDGAFRECRSLTDIIIPESVTNIGSGAFSGCKLLTDIIIPESVTGIGASTFSECTSLTNITIPLSVTSIESRAFEDCSALSSVIIPPNVTRIGDKVFEGCTALKTINIAKPEGSITGAPWYAPNATVNWNYKE